MQHTPPKLHDLPVDELQHILQDTEKLAGPDCQSAKVLRRLIEEKRRQSLPGVERDAD